jgi:hypothetical protein
MNSVNPYQSPELIDDHDEEKAGRVADSTSPIVSEPPIDETCRRLTRIGQTVLVGYFSLLLMVWLSLAFDVWNNRSVGLPVYVRSHHGLLWCLLVLMMISLLGGVACSFTPRRERFYLWGANTLKMIVMWAGFWALLSKRSGNFSLNLIPLLLAVLFALWMISESAILGFLRVSAIRNGARFAAHACELAIGLMAVAAGCFSAWALLRLTAEPSLLSGLMMCVTATMAIAVSIAIWVLRWFPIK